MALGISLSIKSNLGVSHITSIPYVITLISGIDIGISNIVYFTVLVLIQALLLQNKFKIKELFQVPMSIFFGIFLSVFGMVMNLFPDPDNLIMKLILTLISTIFTALGIFLYVPVNIVQLPPDGFNLSVAEVLKIKFSTPKIINDVAMVNIPLVVAVFFHEALHSIGIGTILAALLVGLEVKIITKLCGTKRKQCIY